MAAVDHTIYEDEGPYGEHFDIERPNDTRTPYQRLAAAVLLRAWYDGAEALNRSSKDMAAGRVTKCSNNLRKHVEEVEQLRIDTVRWVRSNAPASEPLTFLYWASILGWGAGEVSLFRKKLLDCQADFESRAREVCGLIGIERTVQLAFI